MGQMIFSNTLTIDDQTPVGMYETDMSFDHLLLYHELWRALLNGQSLPRRRAPLPVELIRIISQQADLVVLDRELTHVHFEGIEVSARDHHVVSKLWFISHPFDKVKMVHVAGVQLATESHDQGWASHLDQGSWTWFDMAIIPFPPLQNTTRDDLAQASLWRKSHHNVVATMSPRELEGPVVTTDDEMWNNLQNDQLYAIVIRANARFAGWTNHAKKGELRVWKYFEPIVGL
ncbi:hypothetical protein QCA50_013133 [Cerrena zonata]|uniref:Uncharacterized protein n=1 Tax=Cerrena zonata TaxID=2478898 RepID=A0AAW0G2G8_9APHY